MVPTPKREPHGAVESIATGGRVAAPISLGSHSSSPGVPWEAESRWQGFPRVPVSLSGPKWPIQWRAERGGGRAGSAGRQESQS